LIDPELRKYWWEKLGYEPHSARQYEIHESKARYKILTCGRRYGKTTLAANELTCALLDPHHPGYYWIVGPKYTTAEKEFRIVYNNIFKKLKLAGHKQIKKSYNVKQGDMVIEMPWGSLLEVKSAQHQDTLLGEGLAGVIMSEAARHTSDTWEQYVRPGLSDISSSGHRGWAIFASTPRGYNWYQGLWLLGQNPNFKDFASWRLPSWENPIVYPGGRSDPEIKEIEREVSPSWFKQEIAAEFTAFAGKIYPDFNPEFHVRSIDYDPTWTNVWFFDYGWANPFVCLDVMIDEEDNFYVWREYMVSERTTMEHARILTERDNPYEYHVDWGAGDPRGPDSANTISQITGVQIYSEDIGDGNAHESWKLGVEYVARMLKIRENGWPKLFIDPSCTELIRQMEQLRAPDIPENKNAQEGQHKHDDHGPDALRYGIGQYMDSGAGSSLSDIYAPGRKRTEAQTFFQNVAPLARYGRY
jgi:hypothetical protein